jgi:DNA-binding transcriptional MerR regulator
MLLKIGELARRTGLTVRTLHHYDAIKLLCPSGRSASGYRLYDRRDIERLHRIQALRRLDMPLADIATLLDGGGANLETVIDQQIAALDRQIEQAATLRKRLDMLRERLRARQEPALDDWLATLAMMNFYGRYFTGEELDILRRSGQPEGPEFHDIKEQIRTLMQQGVPHDAPETMQLAERWITLVSGHLAGDARLMLKVDNLHRSEPNVHLFTGIDAALLDYLTRATAEFRFSLYARHIEPALLGSVRERFLRHYLEWPALFAEVRTLHERCADPLAPEVLDLAARWMALFVAVWGNDPVLHQQVLAVNQLEPEMIGNVGIDNDAVRLVRAAIDHLKKQQGKSHDEAA